MDLNVSYLSQAVITFIIKEKWLSDPRREVHLLWIINKSIVQVIMELLATCNSHSYQVPPDYPIHMSVHFKPQ